MLIQVKPKPHQILILLLATVSFFGGALYCLYTSYYLNSITRLAGAEILAAFGIMFLMSCMHAESFSYDGLQLTISKYWGLRKQTHSLNDIEGYKQAENGKKQDVFFFQIKEQYHMFELDHPDHREMAGLIERHSRNKNSDLPKIYTREVYKFSGIFISTLGTFILLTALSYKVFCINLDDSDLHTFKSQTLASPEITAYKVKVGHKRKNHNRKYEERPYLNIYMKGYTGFVFELKDFYGVSESDSFLTNVGEGDSLYVTVSRSLYEHRIKHSSYSHNFLKDMVHYHNIPVLGLRDAQHTYLDTSHYIQREQNEGNFGAWTFIIIGFLIAGLGTSFIIDANIQEKRQAQELAQERPHSTRPKSKKRR